MIGIRGAVCENSTHYTSELCRVCYNLQLDNVTSFAGVVGAVTLDSWVEGRVVVNVRGVYSPPATRFAT
jgi:hypothetical protein